MGSILYLLEGLYGGICGAGTLYVPGWSSMILTLCFPTNKHNGEPVSSYVTSDFL
jgi:hypothetical protein